MRALYNTERCFFKNEAPQKMGPLHDEDGGYEQESSFVIRIQGATEHKLLIVFLQLRLAAKYAYWSADAPIGREYVSHACTSSYLLFVGEGDTTVILVI